MLLTRNFLSNTIIQEMRQKYEVNKDTQFDTNYDAIKEGK